MKKLRQVIVMALCMALMVCAAAAVFVGCDGSGCSINITSNETQGSVTISPQKDKYEKGEEVTLKVTTQSGYKLKTLLLNKEDIADKLNDNNEYTFKVSKNTVISAQFQEINTYIVRIDPFDETQGSVTVSPEKERYDEGENITISAIPVSGYKVKTLYLGIDDITKSLNENNEYTFTVSKDVTISAEFQKRQDKPNLTFEFDTPDESEGSISVDPILPQYYNGDTISITITEKSKHNVVSFKINGKEMIDEFVESYVYRDSNYQFKYTITENSKMEIKYEESDVEWTKIENINENNFDEAVAKGRYIVDFWATWCDPCKELGPILESIVTTRRMRVKLYKIDYDKNKVFSKERFGITELPVVLFIVDGEVKERIDGKRSFDAYMSLIRKYKLSEYLNQD